MTLAIEIIKLAALVLVFAITVSLLHVGRWLLVAGFRGVQWMAKMLGRKA